MGSLAFLASAIAAGHTSYLQADEIYRPPPMFCPGWPGEDVLMSTKADYSAEEWDLLRASPMMAGILVVAASPSGPIGLVQESAAAGKMILEAAGSAKTPLLKALAEDMKTSMSIPKAPPGASPTAVQNAATEILQRTSELLGKKATPEEATELKLWLAQIAQKTAEATKEGGFLGFGGTLVSEEEKAAVAKVNSSLGLAAA